MPDFSEIKFQKLNEILEIAENIYLQKLPAIRYCDSIHNREYCDFIIMHMIVLFSLLHRPNVCMYVCMYVCM